MSNWNSAYGQQLPWSIVGLVCGGSGLGKFDLKGLECET